MNLDQFYSAFVNQTMDYDGVYPNQCVDLAKYYLDRCFGIKPGAWGDAWAYFGGEGCRQLQARGWTKVPNNHNDVNQVPPRGALIVWDATLAGSGGGGHVAVVWQANPGAATFISFDENWGGNTAHLVTHNWSKVLGWMVPPQGGRGADTPAPAAPAQAPQGGDEMIANADQATKIYKMLRPNGAASADEINGTAGRRSFANFLNDAQNEINQRDANLRAQAQHTADLQATIDQLNQTITNLQANGVQSKQQLDAALAQVADLTSQLTNSHDQLKELQDAQPTSTPNVPVAQQPQATPEQPKAGLFVKLIAALLRRKK